MNHPSIRKPLIFRALFLARISRLSLHPSTATSGGCTRNGPIPKTMVHADRRAGGHFLAARLLRRRGLPTGAAHPQTVVAADEQRLFGRDDILDGQTAWQSVGGMQLGSVWGHGAYQAPDWTADWLHRELGAWLDLAAREAHGQPYAELPAPAQAALRETPQGRVPWQPRQRGRGADGQRAPRGPSPRPPLTMTSCFPMRRRCTQAASISR